MFKNILMTMKVLLANPNTSNSKGFVSQFVAPFFKKWANPGLFLFIFVTISIQIEKSVDGVLEI